MVRHSIPIGSVDDKFQLCYSLGAFAIYSRLRSGSSQVKYVVAPQPKKTRIGNRPASVLQEFDDLQSARATLERWAQDPLPPKPACSLGKCCRNSKRKRRATAPATGQLDLPLNTDPRQAAARKSNLDHRAAPIIGLGTPRNPDKNSCVNN